MLAVQQNSDFISEKPIFSNQLVSAADFSSLFRKKKKFIGSVQMSVGRSSSFQRTGEAHLFLRLALASHEAI